MIKTNSLIQSINGRYDPFTKLKKLFWINDIITSINNLLYTNTKNIEGLSAYILKPKNSNIYRDKLERISSKYPNLNVL